MGFVIARIRRRPTRSTATHVRLNCGLCSSLLLFIALPAWPAAVEPAEDFVKGLQDRGLHGLALEYLDGLKTSPLANDATQSKFPTCAAWP